MSMIGTMSYIQEGLYLGDVDDAYNTQWLKNKGVTHILTIEREPLRKEATAGFKYKCIHALDMDSSDLLSHFEECIEFIEEGRREGGVLVHCLVGMSRSATIVLSYLMYKLDMGVDDALTLLMKLRPSVRPNSGFRSQLELFESMGNRLDKNYKEYKLYRLNTLAKQIQTAQIQDSLPEGSLCDDPANKSQVPGETLYKCRKCRQPLFKASSILSHPTGRGEMAFGWKSKINYSPQDEEVTCQESLFIEPVKWMERDILNIEGKLSCLKCQAKLGSFTWAGERCPCGTWVTPAFHIQTSKVDKSRVVCPFTSLPPRIQPYSAQESVSSTSSASVQSHSAQESVSSTSPANVQPHSAQESVSSISSASVQLHSTQESVSSTSPASVQPHSAQESVSSISSASVQSHSAQESVSSTSPASVQSHSAQESVSSTKLTDRNTYTVS